MGCATCESCQFPGAFVLAAIMTPSLAYQLMNSIHSGQAGDLPCEEKAMTELTKCSESHPLNVGFSILSSLEVSMGSFRPLMLPNAPRRHGWHCWTSFDSSSNSVACGQVIQASEIVLRVASSAQSLN